jgi:putative tryptophan/tyrosine transport system substrate-binding protein
MGARHADSHGNGRGPGCIRICGEPRTGWPHSDGLNIQTDVSAKFLELLLAAAPHIKRVGFLLGSTNVLRAQHMENARNIAAKQAVDEDNRVTTRRIWLMAFGACMLAGPVALVARAQQPARLPRVGVLGRPQHRDALRQGLRELGWIDGKNIIIEYRAGTSGDVVRELSGAKVDCIVAGGNLAIETLKHAAPGVPLVMAATADPVGSGFVASLRRPGGNITGLSNINEALTGKRLELLKELRPRMSRVAVLKSPAIPAHNTIWIEAQSSAASLGMKVFPVDYRTAQDFERCYAAIVTEKAEGLLVPQSPLVIREYARILKLAASERLPAMFQSSSVVEMGGLISYGPDETDMWRRAGGYVDKILKGAKPGDLPVEQPTKFELIINLKTAREIGLTVPANMLARASRVIE